MTTQVSATIEAVGDKDLSMQKLNITLTLLDKADKPIATLNPQAASDGATHPSFNISSEISGLNAVALIVDVRHEGFTSFSRRTPIEPFIYLTVNLAELEESIVMPAQVTSISGTKTNGFTLQAKDPVDGETNMSISIPASSLPAGTGSLTAAIKTYDPNDANDAQYFPGSYADSTGNRLVSVAFNYAEVKTSTGESLQSIAQNARAMRQAVGAVAFLDPPEPVIINRDIPVSSCSTLEKLGDANPALAGFQIPVYTYNSKSGLWDLLGYGTVFTDAGVAIPGNASDLDCANLSYVLEIKVTNEIFLSDWWNLDYPLQFSQPQKLCANLRMVNEANEPLAGVSGLITGNGDFASRYFVSDVNGNVAVSIDAFNSEVESGNFIIWGGNGDAHGTIELSPTCPASTSQTLIVKRPQLCKIKGKVQYGSGKGVRGIGVYAIGEENILSQYFWGIGLTDSKGDYTLDVSCNEPYKIFFLENDLIYEGINVNEKTEVNELADANKQVILAPYTLTKLPMDTVLNAGYDLETQEGVILVRGMYDAFPVTYDLQLKNTVTNQVIVSAKGSLTFDNTLWGEDFDLWYARIGLVRVPFALPADTNNLVVVGTLVDSFGVKQNIYQPFGGEEESDN